MPMGPHSGCAIWGAGLPWRGSRAGVCPTCWAGVVPHAGPTCDVCGHPGVEAEGPCLECRTAPPPWRAAASFGAYDGVLRELVLLFKSRGRDELAAPLAGLPLAASRRGGWAPLSSPPCADAAAPPRLAAPAEISCASFLHLSPCTARCPAASCSW